MKNTVIANRKKTDWPIIKKYFESRGVNMSYWGGDNIGIDEFYYGIIDGKTSCFYLEEAQQVNATILEVSDIEKEFKVGDIVVVTQNTNEQGKVTEITCKHNTAKKYFNLKGCNHPYKTSQMRHATPEEIKKYKGISENVTLPKSFVLEAHKSACSDWKKRIEEVVPELFPKNELNPKIGKWYMQIDTDDRYILSCFQGMEKYQYGFNVNGDWSTQIGKAWLFGNTKENRLATEQEVFEALKNEAVKRGFKEGVETEHGKISSNHSPEFIIKDNMFYFNNIKAFEKGVWTKIISEPIPQELESLISKLGKKKILEFLKD